MCDLAFVPPEAFFSVSFYPTIKSEANTELVNTYNMCVKRDENDLSKFYLWIQVCAFSQGCMRRHAAYVPFVCF